MFLCNVKKELGKWFMDIAKYLATAILLSYMFSDLSNGTLLVWAVVTTAICLIGGLIIINNAEKIENKKNNKKKKK